MLEVERYEGKIFRNFNSRFTQDVALPGLRGGEVYLEDLQIGEWIAIGKGVEARAEDDVLAQAPGDRLSKAIFGIAAAKTAESIAQNTQLMRMKLHFLLARINLGYQALRSGFGVNSWDGFRAVI